MRLPGAAKVLVSRRRRPLVLMKQGPSFNGAAQRLVFAPSSVMRWTHAHRRHGEAALKLRNSPDRPHDWRAGRRIVRCVNCFGVRLRLATMPNSGPLTGSPT